MMIPDSKSRLEKTIMVLSDIVVSGYVIKISFPG